MESCFWTNGLDDSILWSRETGESGKVIKIQTFLKSSESERFVCHMITKANKFGKPKDLECDEKC